jgi:hypothetical protein
MINPASFSHQDEALEKCLAASCERGVSASGEWNGSGRCAQVAARCPERRSAYLSSSISHRRRNSVLGTACDSVPKQESHGQTNIAGWCVRVRRWHVANACVLPADRLDQHRRFVVPPRVDNAPAAAASVCGDDAERPSASAPRQLVPFHTIFLASSFLIAGN